MNEILKQNKTAFYVFDVKTLKDRVAYLRKMLPEDVAICYAIKANTFITAELENDVDRFEICSPGEAEICDLLDIPIILSFSRTDHIHMVGKTTK